MIYRKEIVRGVFYNSSRRDLISQIKSLFLDKKFGPGKLPSRKNTNRNVIGCIVPHAGYSFSGNCSAHAYYELSRQVIPETIILIGPNHQGIGSGAGVFPEGKWMTPLNDFTIDKSFVNKLLKNSESISSDELSHTREHSIEVQLPMIDFIYEGNNPEIVPISISYSDFETTMSVANDLLNAYRDSGKRIIFIASSDFSHVGPSYGYMPYDKTGEELNEKVKMEDLKLMNAVKKIDTKEYFKILEEKKLTVCGSGAIGVLMHIFKKMKNKNIEGRLLKQYTSGEITGEYTNFVDYASIIFETK